MTKISVLCPTRSRPERLIKSIESLLQTANHPEGIEILLAFDDDDKKSQKVVSKVLKEARTFITKRFGYQGLHEYYNLLSEKSTGKWLFLWNDDCIMETQGWDDIVRSFDGKLVMLNTKYRCGEGNEIIYRDVLFPIVPRLYYELVGHLSLNRHNDSWMQNIFFSLDRHPVVDIVICHRRGDFEEEFKDEVFEEGRKQYLNLSEDDSFRSGTAVDSDILRKYISENPEV